MGLPLNSVYDIWLASRALPNEPGARLIPGGQRPINSKNMRLAFQLLQGCILSFLKELWSRHRIKTSLLMSLHLVRSLFPAFRGYSQALIIDEIQSMVTSGMFTWICLVRLIATEVLRRVAEGLLNSLAASTEDTVLGSAKFFVEHHQLELRVKLDTPTLADPVIRDLLAESDLFSRSFHGGGFGIISPFDFIQIFAHLAEIFSHLLLMLSLTRNVTHFNVLLLSIISVSLPSILASLGFSPAYPDPSHGSREAQAASLLEKMRSIAYSEAYRSEIALFGLGDWLLLTWSNAWKIIFASTDQTNSIRNPSLLSDINVSDFLFAFQNIPLVLLLQTSSASLGSLTLYRSCVQSVILSFRSLVVTTRMTFQAVFLMSAFCASMQIKPKMEPDEEEVSEYLSTGNGMRLRIRGLTYTYPGCTEPALRDVNLNVQEGEMLAIVGYNGSGKTTLANVLLRIIDFDSGQILINGVNIRQYHPHDFYNHVSAVFQNFSKFNLTVQENIGLGYVPNIGSEAAVTTAVHLAEADGIVESLPLGLHTALECPSFGSYHSPSSLEPSNQHHGLSGGEWQRVALARAFMRAETPEIDLLLFDEPTSSLDAHAQSQIFDTIRRISQPPNGRRKTVIFITHRLSTARRADKVAMMENGTIVEYGTHEDLLGKGGAYAVLYQQSV